MIISQKSPYFYTPLFLLLFLVFFPKKSFSQNKTEEKAQEEKTEIKIENHTIKQEVPSWSWSIEGQIGVFSNGEAFFANLGGPNFRFKHKKWTIAWFVAPTLRFWEDAPRPFVVPTIGTGLEISYKKIGIGLPFFFNNVKNEWTPAVGIIYKMK